MKMSDFLIFFFCNHSTVKSLKAMYGVRGLNENDSMLCQKYQYVRLAACFLTGHWDEGSWRRGGGGR